MGSPIETWDGAAAYFTGAGGSSPGILLAISVIVCFAAIAYGALTEEKAYKDHL